MIHQQTLIQTTTRGQRHDPVATRLHGRRLVFVRVICIVVVAFTLGLFGTGLVITFLQHQAICTGLTCVFPIPEALVYLAVASLIFRYRSDDWMAMVVALMLVLMAPISTLPDMTLNILGSVPILQVLLAVSAYLTFASFLLFCFLFPSGRFVPRWTRWVVVVYLLWSASLVLLIFWLPSWLNSDAAWSLYLAGAIFGLLLLVMFTQVYRYQEASTLVERQQSKWAMAGTSVAVWGWFLSLFLWGPDARVILLLIPLSFGIAVLGYRLYDIDVLINRALIYGTLTGTLALVYFGLVFVLQLLLRGLIGQQNDVAMVVSTLAVAALFQPLRRGIQQVIDRRFYRRKYDARRIIDAFSATLRAETNLTQLSEQLVAVVEETMQPAHVSLWLRPAEQDRTHRASWRANPPEQYRT
jgi:hypothetical protein